MIDRAHNLPLARQAALEFDYSQNLPMGLRTTHNQSFAITTP
jgi:hypothetical protein